MKRFAFALMLALLCVGLFCVAAEASSSGTCGDNLTWTLNDAGTLKISGTGEMLNYSTASNSRPWGTDIKSVEIENGVTSIGNFAFYYCSNLNNVSIPSSIISIGEKAFGFCSKLTSVTIPASVTNIGDRAFMQCKGLTNITLSEGLTCLGYDMFELCEGLTNVTIPSSVTNVKQGVFSECYNLTTATFSDGVSFIGNSMFYRCQSLTNVTIPSSVIKIENGAFTECYMLKNITIPSSVQSIGIGAFSYTGISSISIPSSVKSIGASVFSIYDKLTDVYYTGTEAEKAQISISEDNAKLNSATWHYTPASYTVAFDANGGSVDTASKTVTNGSAYGDLPIATQSNYSFDGWFTSASGGTQITSNTTVDLTADQTLYAHWTYTPTSYTVTFNANGGAVSTSSKTVTNGSTYGDLPTPTRSNFRFDGWFTAANGGTQVKSNTTVNLNDDQTLYAHWTKLYEISYNANGGTGTPSPQTKEEDVSLTLSNFVPSKSYVIQYNANGGSVSPASKNVNCIFNNWNTEIDGSGISYAAGGTYATNAGATLYAQWTNPVAGTLATPSRDGYIFTGWFSSATGGEQINENSSVIENITIFAHWFNAYNMKDETYSFKNYPDWHDRNGHCFGMSITSGGYYNNLIDIKTIGGNANTPLYSFADTKTVRKPICYYQERQGKIRDNSTIAGGTWYLEGVWNPTKDWQEVVNYVRNHKYDNTGLLQIGIRNPAGGHAINFLRYENVNGQDRIYAYDNNFPDQETYIYRDTSGIIRQAPLQSLTDITCIALRDIRIYFKNVKNFDATHVIYTTLKAITLVGCPYTFMEGGASEDEYIMYEIPADQDIVIVIPNKDNADFIYMDTEYSFAEITDKTRGKLNLSSMDEGAVTAESIFEVFEADTVFGKPSFTLPSLLEKIGNSVFEGVKATVVYIPDSCTSIGEYAFRNSGIKQIRIPLNCKIADTAFDGCTDVEIFGTPGSDAEKYCKAHENCIFIAE